jgi:hypothetical protein
VAVLLTGAQVLPHDLLMAATCQHGIEIGGQGGVAIEDSRSWTDAGLDDSPLLEFYSACDCCDTLMHHSTPYHVLKDGRTLCDSCYSGEETI